MQLTSPPSGLIALTKASAPAPVAGQRVVVYNATTQAATFNGQGSPAGRAVEFFYSTAASGFVASAGTGADSFWSLRRNAGTTPGTTFIGTTDAQDFVARSNNMERLRVGSDGNVQCLTCTSA